MKTVEEIEKNFGELVETPFAKGIQRFIEYLNNNQALNHFD